jgi:acyl carrier protein
MMEDRTAARPDLRPVAGPAREQVRERLLALLNEICDLGPGEIRDTSTIDRDLDLESVQMVELQVAIEQEFDVTIDFLEVLRVNSFRGITDYIHRLAVERAETA